MALLAHEQCARYMRRFFAEFLGTLLLVLLGTSAVAQSRYLSGLPVLPPIVNLTTVESENPVIVNNTEYLRAVLDGSARMTSGAPPVATTNFVPVALGFGLALTAGVLVAGNASGGHLNPAVTLAMVALGKLKPAYLPLYWAAQYAGAGAAAFAAYVVHRPLLRNEAFYTVTNLFSQFRSLQKF